MPNKLTKKFLDLKTWDMCSPVLTASTTGGSLIQSEGPDQGILYIASATLVYYYSPFEDGWIMVTSPALAGTFGAGTCGKYHPFGPTGVAQAGSGAGTIVSNLAIQFDLSPPAGKYFAGRVTSGTGTGQDFRIISCTTNTANSVFKITQLDGVTPLATALDTTSNFILFTGRFYILNAGTLAAGSFRYFDLATQTWSGNLSIVNLPATIATDGRMTSTTSNAVFSKGTFDSTDGVSTLTQSRISWSANQWTGSQLRFTSGAAIGTTFPIASNTGAAVAIAGSFSPVPAAGDTFVIEGNTDSLYFTGNGAIAMYKYSIASGLWSVITPAVARSSVTAASFSFNWIYGCDSAQWTDETAIINGRKIYSFRGATSFFLDVYDIPTNSWSVQTYGAQAETVISGTSWVYDGNNRIISQFNPVSGAPMRFAALNLASNMMSPFGVLMYLSGGVVVANKIAILEYDDGVGTPMKFLYNLRPQGTEMHRCEII